MDAIHELLYICVCASYKGFISSMKLVSSQETIQAPPVPSLSPLVHRCACTRLLGTRAQLFSVDLF